MSITAPELIRPAPPGTQPATLLLAPKPPKIAIHNLGFRYGDTVALKGVTFDLPENQVIGLIGPSGCGKSTLLRVLNRLYDMYPGQVASGGVLLDGADILGAEVDLRRLRARVGMVFQEATTLPMSIRGNIAFGIRLHESLSRVEMNRRVERALTRAALWSEVKDRLSEDAAELSGGQQQRLCIARALAVNPEVLLLDEPTSALDPHSMAMIEQLIDTLKQSVTIVLVTHNHAQAARCADQVAFLYLGEMVECGAATQIFSAPREPRTQRYVTGRFG
ncbi:phosphate ABC transporter ATP-binding protein [Falsiroseomonas selenitidurans]|uniref:ATP-binding cassette domain-containing protein n=1 Tax=Falsiroseomonas selenitidurans TaxID=2716335 RepID=A0ABX1E9T8_9PROT|nr:phosphate ABC transporter ATP-binding protein [Falsiroseomonas selenitidurans]NKC33621.1 ATP-binding cassette domain-containing protein [Falsiroseomonas selenitidurans]